LISQRAFRASGIIPNSAIRLEMAILPKLGGGRFSALILDAGPGVPRQKSMWHWGE
jgi:hypothetical protein